MTAELIAAALGNPRSDGREWRAQCPLCNGPLALRDGDRGLLAKCWGSCSPAAVYRELRRLGHLSAERPAPLSPDERARSKAEKLRARRRKIERGLEFWHESLPLVGTLADEYLKSRGIDAASPYLSHQVLEVLRFHPRLFYAPGVFRPALLGLVRHVHQGDLGVAATYLGLDGGKSSLDPPRLFWAPVREAAVQLAAPRPDREFIVGEGIETVLSVMLACELPGWAALSANGIANVVLPHEARHIIVAADRDPDGIGERAARAAAGRFLREGRRVRLALPPLLGDWNDILIGAHHGA